MSQSLQPLPSDEDQAKEKNPFAKVAEHAVPLPPSWWVRWPALGIVVAVLAVLAGIGHLMGGIGEIAKLIEAKLIEPASPPPLTMALSEHETRSLDGYKINEAVH